MNLQKLSDRTHHTLPKRFMKQGKDRISNPSPSTKNIKFQAMQRLCLNAARALKLKHNDERGKFA